MTQLIIACYVINWLCVKVAAEKLDIRSVTKTLKAERFVFEAIMLNKVDA